MCDGLLWERVCARHGSCPQGVCQEGQGKATKSQTDIRRHAEGNRASETCVPYAWEVTVSWTGGLGVHEYD